MLRERQAKPAGRHFSLLDQARALAVVLSEEFGVRFALHESATGTEVQVTDRGAAARSETTPLRAKAGLDPTAVTALAKDGRAHVTTLPSGSYQLVVPLFDLETPILVAVG